MKRNRRLFAMLLTMVMCIAMTTPAFAANDPVIVPVIYEERVVGTSADMEFCEDNLTITSYRPDVANIARANNLLFTMSANFQNFLPSIYKDSSKYFTFDDITKGCLKISGTLGSTNSNCTQVEVGYAFYNATKDEYKSVGYAFFNNNIYSAAYFTGFDFNTRYYGYAKKVDPGNYYITGYLDFWNSDER